MPSQPFSVPAVLLFVLAVPLALRLIPRNGFYGVRLHRTMSDDGTWYSVNRVAGLAVIAACLIYGAVALLAPYDPHRFSTWLVHLAAFVLPLIAGLAFAVRYRNR